MNKRIRQLYEQAHETLSKQVRKGGWDNDREPFEYHIVNETTFDPEKFAELIVAECMKLNRDILCEDDPDYLDKVYKEHFGVE